MGDAVHRHPPSNGLGSDTSIQDVYNLAWKLALVLRGTAGEGLLHSFDAERAPVGKQIVLRAGKSIEEFGPIFAALGVTCKHIDTRTAVRRDQLVVHLGGAAGTLAGYGDDGLRRGCPRWYRRSAAPAARAGSSTGRPADGKG